MSVTKLESKSIISQLLAQNNQEKKFSPSLAFPCYTITKNTTSKDHQYMEDFQRREEHANPDTKETSKLTIQQSETIPSISSDIENKIHMEIFSSILHKPHSSIISETTQLPFESDPKYYKYLKMLNVGLPKGAIIQKMILENADVNFFFNSISNLRKVKQNETVQPHLEKYKKMLQIGLKKEAVFHRMRLDGINPQILGLEQENFIEEKKEIQIKKTKQIPWRTLPLHQLKETGSFWSTNLMLKEHIDMSKEIESFFLDYKKEQKLKKTLQSKSKDLHNNFLYSRGSSTINLLDPKRSQNIAIALARIKISFSEIKAGILHLNTTVLSSLQIESLLELWPSNDELKQLRNFSGDRNRLGKTEQFVIEMMDIPRIENKLKCLMYKQSYKLKIEEIRERLKIMVQSLLEITSSKSLKQILILFLQIGNYINKFGQDPYEKAYGFSLDSLNKFVYQKSFDSKTTILQYALRIIQIHFPSLLNFAIEFRHLPQSSSISFHQLHLDYNLLKDELQIVTIEADSAYEIKELEITAEEDLNNLQCEFENIQKMITNFKLYFGEIEEMSIDLMLQSFYQFTKDFENGKELLKRERRQTNAYAA